ncbi:MAG: nucleoside kinase, partial [Bacteroidales bacterium]|nr:nucleoside kinase [Bacteroidales bacterium]
LAKASYDVFPGCRIYMEHSIANGYYCNLKKADHSAVSKRDIALIRKRMREIVSKDMPFHRYEMQTEEAIRTFGDRGYDDKVKLLETSGQPYTDYYMLGDTVDYYYGRLVPSAGYLTVWGLEKYHQGMLLRVPDADAPEKLAEFRDQPKTFKVFTENLRWNIIMGLNTVGDVNHACQNGRASELIRVSEALQEKKIVQIAEEIAKRCRSENPLKVVLITGPSSSGKTTFCHRLSIQLMACGLHPLSFSTDDFFINRVDTPKLPNGQYDFDNFETVDHKYLEDVVQKLLKGQRVDMPSYNFVTGEREYKGKKYKYSKGNVLLIEGIHALNPALIPNIPDEMKYRIFINTITSTSLDNHNWIPTSDNRLLRRIIRDHKMGSFSAIETIRQWPDVCAAEKKWILPYQENADVMFNSAYLIEFAVLRLHAEMILNTIPKNCPEYSESHRLLKFIRYFTPVSDNEIPNSSLLREFLGGSSFTGLRI